MTLPAGPTAVTQAPATGWPANPTTAAVTAARWPGVACPANLARCSRKVICATLGFRCARLLAAAGLLELAEVLACANALARAALLAFAAGAVATDALIAELAAM